MVDIKRYCIINVDGMRDADLYDAAPIGCEVLRNKRVPRCFYRDKDQAEMELFRLAAKYPAGKFQLFESTEMPVEYYTSWYDGFKCFRIEKIEGET